MNTTLWIMAAIALLVITFLPRIGLLAIYKTYRIALEREQVEDALKHLLDREQQGRYASPESLAGTLDMQRGTCDAFDRKHGNTRLARITRRGAASHHKR